MLYDGPPGLMLDLVPESQTGVDIEWVHPYTAARPYLNYSQAYNYAANNPIRFIDPSGLRPYTCQCDCWLPTYPGGSSTTPVVIDLPPHVYVGDIISKECRAACKALAPNCGYSQYDDKYHIGIKYCYSKLPPAQTCAKGINASCGGPHALLVLGPVDTDNERLPGTKGWGFPGPTSDETPATVCYNLIPNSNKLMHGKCAGAKTGLTASEECIWDCIINTKPSWPYTFNWYDCRHYADEAARSCGLTKPTGATRPW